MNRKEEDRSENRKPATQPSKRAEELALKSTFGAALSSSEAQELQAFLETKAGQTYLAGVRDTQAVIRQAGQGQAKEQITGQPVLDSAAIQELRRRFEESMRDQAQASRKHFLGIVLLAFGAAAFWSLFFGTILPRFHPKQPGPGDVLSLWLILFGAASVFCAYIYYRMREMERAPDLFDRLTKRGRRMPRTIADHLRRWPILLLLVYWTGRQEGWICGLLFIPLLWVVFALAAHFLRKSLQDKRMGEDEELWTWWYGELD